MKSIFLLLESVAACLILPPRCLQRKVWCWFPSSLLLGPFSCSSGPYDPRPLDVWSCGIVYLALVFVGYLWPAADTENKTYKNFILGWEKFLKKHPDGLVTSDQLPNCGRPFQAIPNPSMRRLVLSMLHPDPTKRATIDDIIKDRYFKSIDCCVTVDDPAENATQLDASCKSSSLQASKMRVKKDHSHTPPRTENKLLSMIQHRFDMGDGYS